MSSADLPGFFLSIEAALADGYYLAGYLTYEAGAALLGVPAHPLTPGEPLAKFGLYNTPMVFDHLAVHHESDSGRGHEARFPLAMLPTVSPEVYEARVRQVHHWIASGDTYQVNYTTPFRSGFAGNGLQAYTKLAIEQPCSYSALLRLDAERTILSFSPELFFATAADGHITTRPMKGTAPRAAPGVADEKAMLRLQHDEKNRAEHVMIVDLLRNDLGRICEIGSVQTQDLFHVEPYPTLHQMVSTVRGKLRRGIPWQEIFTSVFPSGSITGAPKRRTMQIIHEIENRPRGIYTGAIGYIAPSGESAFSVAIRTLELQDNVLSMGVGGGIVADSVAADEWRECLLKTSFVHRGSKDLYLIETMLVQGSPAHVVRLPLHMARLARSARALGFRMDDVQVLDAITEAVSIATTEPMRMRLTLSRSGETTLKIEPFVAWPTHLRVRIAPECTDPEDPSLHYKTTFRHRYDQALTLAREQGWDECLFLNSRDELAEGCITNLLLAKGGNLWTPALSCGVLSGVFRQSMMDAGLVQGAVLTMQDLVDADAILLCNSVRGAVPVKVIQLRSREMLNFNMEEAERVRNFLHSNLEKTGS